MTAPDVIATCCRRSSSSPKRRHGSLSSYLRLGLSDMDSGNADSEQYAAEYWSLDAEAQGICYELAPDYGGESVSLGDLDELCQRMRRPLRDDNERQRLMNELDPQNEMRISRAAFTTWLLQDLYHERELAMAREYQQQVAVVPVAAPSWEEHVDLATTARYYANIWTGETTWELPGLVQGIWDHLAQVEELRALKASGVSTDADDRPTVELLADLRDLFLRYDEDRSGALDTSEFQDFCVAMGQSVARPDGGQQELFALMHAVDPFSGGAVVSWEALMHYWITNAPFQRRTRLAAPFELWERVEILNQRDLAPTFRHVVTQSERWNHPRMEQNIVDLLMKLFPSAKLEWRQRVTMFIDLQAKTKLKPGTSETSPNTGSDGAMRWNLAQCASVLTQFGHEVTRKSHLLTTLKVLAARYGGESQSHHEGDVIALDAETIERWCMQAVESVEMDGWSECVDPGSGQVYYYHEINGVTQWDPPHLNAQMAKMMARFGGGDGGSDDSKIQRIFHHYDVDESGSIGFDEFRRFYVALLGKKTASTTGASGAQGDVDDGTLQQIHQVFSVLDTSGDGEVSLEEFTMWWKTKLQIEEVETEDSRKKRIANDRTRVALEFLRANDVLILKDEKGSVATGENGTSENRSLFFESNALPRLVSLLGKYPLKGLAYRHALRDLVHSFDQEIRLSDFLEWYDNFEQKEKEKEELEAQKARALALLQAQEAEAKEKARKLKMLRKGQLITKKIGANEKPREPAEVIWRRHVETLFNKYDRDGSGFLDAPELQELASALGHPLDGQQAKQMIAVMDTSGDQRVSLDEFLTFWTAFQRKKTTTDKKSKAGVGKGDALSPAKSDGSKERREAISMVEATASLAVSFELAKDKAFKLSLDDIKGTLGDWKEAFADRGRKKKELQALAEEEQRRHEELKKQWVFVPTGKRRYAHLDVTWIEPDVVCCVVDMIRIIAADTHPLPRPDAAQRIQRIIRGVVTRQRVLEMITRRFMVHLDVRTSFYYYVDTEMNGLIWLHRPVYRTLTSSVVPWEFEDCHTKIERRSFTLKQREMEQKKQYVERSNLIPHGIPASTFLDKHRLLVPAGFVLYEALEAVRLRLLGNIWGALRDKSFILVELMARRHRRQLQQRSQSDASLPLPLHYVIRKHQEIPFEVVKAIYDEYPEALTTPDAGGRTPLHLAFRERARLSIFELLLSKRKYLHNHKKSKSVWEMQTQTGDTALHAAIRYRCQLETLRWVLSGGTHGMGVPLSAAMIRNDRGEAVFHAAVNAYCPNRAPYWKSVFLALCRAWTSERVCSYPTTNGDLPIHLAIQALERFVLQRHKSNIHSSERNAHHEEMVAWQWLVDRIVDASPDTLLVRRPSDGLLALHLAIRATLLPDQLVIAVYKWTRARLQSSTSQPLHIAMILPVTATTILHYVLLHRPQFEELLQLILEDFPETTAVTMLPNGDLPIHLAAQRSTTPAVMRRLCEVYGRGCSERNRKSEFPLHLAITCPNPIVENVRLLLHWCPFILQEPKERHGLRALVMAANQKHPHVGVLTELLSKTPPQPIKPDARKREVTPLYALSLRKCDESIQTNGILQELEDEFEVVEDEDEYFLSMAKAKNRRRHHCPNRLWSFPKIIDLMERNPVDEAILQRALLAINEKLLHMMATPGGTADNQLDSDGGGDSSKVILETVTLNSDWMLVRRIHQTMFEKPWNARIQLLGQKILVKLLPTAYAKAAYKSRIDPYFNL